MLLLCLVLTVFAEKKEGGPEPVLLEETSLRLEKQLQGKLDLARRAKIAGWEACGLNAPERGSW